MENAIEIKNLSKKYKEFEIKNMNLTLPKGSIMGFIGENGAGKSTTMKLIMDLVRKDSGDITVLGMKNTKDQTAWKERVGVVLDECTMPDAFKLKNINTVMRNAYKNWDKKKFNDFTKRFSLSEDKFIKDFSRGMKMKLSIAMAMSHGAELLILDEATSGLDPIVRDQILEVFMEFIEDENHSIFVSSHITSDLEKICDYITFISNGKIVMSETKDEILENFGILKCSSEEFEKIDKCFVKGVRKNKFGVEALVLREGLKRNNIIDKANLEDIMLFHVKEVI